MKRLQQTLDMIRTGPEFDRAWAMPNADTFAIEPIRDFVLHYLAKATVSVDPFARNSTLATHRNDLNPETQAQHHMDAEAFLVMLAAGGVKADVVLFDPPYSPRQISECYKSIGREVGTEGTQNSVLYQRVRDAILPVLAEEGVVLSFGWNSVGMGKERRFGLEEVLLVCHGGAHNDTICIAERRLKR